jgi:hypothetical protein
MKTDLESELLYILKLCKSQYVRGMCTQSAYEMGVQTALEQVLDFIQNNKSFDVEELNLEHEAF